MFIVCIKVCLCNRQQILNYHQKVTLNWYLLLFSLMAFAAVWHQITNSLIYLKLYLFILNILLILKLDYMYVYYNPDQIQPLCQSEMQSVWVQTNLKVYKAISALWLGMYMYMCTYNWSDHLIRYLIGLSSIHILLRLHSCFPPHNLHGSIEVKIFTHFLHTISNVKHVSLSIFTDIPSFHTYNETNIIEK